MHSAAAPHPPTPLGKSTSRAARLALAASLVVGLGMRLAVLLQSAPLDDAYITFRYARNLAAGLGFVYNAGERVLGTTTPLWTLLLTPIAWAKLPLEPFALSLGLALDLLVCVLLWRLLARHVDVVIASFAAAFYATFYAVVAACGYGMETQFFMFLVVLTFTWSVEKHAHLAAIAAATATLTRPEGLLLAGILIVPSLVRSLRRRQSVVPWRAVALFAGILALWSIAAKLYFGSPLPHSVLAKAFIRGMGPADWLQFFFLRNPLVILLWVLAGVGGIVALRSRNGTLLQFLAWTVTYLLFFLVGDPAFFAAWYFPPLVLSLVVLAAAGSEGLLRDIIRRPSHRIAAVCAAWILLMLVLMPRTLESSRATQRAAELVYRPLAAWVRQETGPEDVVFAGDVGYLGYFSERRILDSAALVSPEVLQFYAAHTEDPVRDVRFILEHRPRLVVVSMGFGAYGHLRESEFPSAYVPRRRFSLTGATELAPAEDPARSRRNPERLLADYLVYERHP